MTRYGMAIDLRRCIGCQACAAACKMANNVPQDIFWTRALTDGGDMMDTPAGEFPDISMRYITVSCQHCENPACAKVCPVGATYKDPETGVVRQDYDKCIGCRMCMSACPYNGVRSFNWEEPVFHTDYAMGSKDAPEHQQHVVEKCTFCYHRTSQGIEPACMHLCVGRARFWGDLDDPTSEVSRLLAERSHKRLLEDRGTEPSTYYLV